MLCRLAPPVEIPHATHFAGLFVILDTMTPTHLPFFLLVLIVISRPTHSSQGPFRIGINYRRVSDPKHASISVSLFVLPSLNFLDQSKIISEP